MTEHSEWESSSTRRGTTAHFCGCGFRPEGTLDEQNRLTQEHVLASGGQLWDGISR